MKRARLEEFRQVAYKHLVWRLYQGRFTIDQRQSRILATPALDCAKIEYP